MPRQFSIHTVVVKILNTKDLAIALSGSQKTPACPPPHHCRPRLTALHPMPIEALSPIRMQAILNLVKCPLLTIALLATLFSSFAAARQPAEPSQDNTHDSGAIHGGHPKMNERGEKGMGFSQTATTHHFLLKPDGGVIQAETNDPKDTVTRDSIRVHLTHIAHAFTSGDFDIPMLVHDTVPPGVPEMKRLNKKISYTFEQTPAGGRVVIATSDPQALAAIHKYLRFQIAEHQTHDPTTHP